MEIKDMTLSEIDQRMAAIGAELETEGADIDALETEVRSLKERKNMLVEAAEKRAKIKQEVERGAGTVVKDFKPEFKQPDETYTRDSEEYKNAWLKDIAKDERGNNLLGEMTKEERAAFTFLTTNTTALVPTSIENRIVELVDSQSPILNDATMTYFTRGFGVPRHKSIDAGDAAVTAEGVANADDEQDTFDLLSLDGVEIKKHVVMSRKMEIQSIEAFENWLVEHLAARIRVAKEKRALAQLDNTTYGIAAENILTGTLDDTEIRKIFAAIKQTGEKIIYANSNTIWTVIAGLETQQGDKLFIPNAMADPLVAGRVYGAKVKEDENLADGIIYVGVPKSLLCNDFEALAIVPQIEAKTLNRIFTAYSLFDAGLENPKAFVKYTHTQG